MLTQTGDTSPALGRGWRAWLGAPGWRTFLADPVTVLSACLIVAVVLRLYGIQLVQTSDEGYWMLRSLRFGAALSRHDYIATYQSGHPGVTVMWTGALGMGRDRMATFLAPRFVDYRAVETAPGFLDLFDSAREATAVVTAALMTLAVGLAWRLLGREAGLLGGALLLLDPYVTGMTRLLHVDALLAPLMTVSALAALLWWTAGRWPYLLLSAVAGGLALLTKAPAAYLPIYFGLAGLAIGRPWRLRGRQLWNWLGGVVAWGLGAGGMYVALWPAMWVDPVAVFGDVVTFARTVGGQPHDWSNFFLGEAITQDPGPAFYLIALAFRLGPVALVGLLALAVVATIWRRLERPTAALAIALYVLGFVLLMTLGGKKFDRYMLPAIVMLDLLAGAGVWEVARRLGRRQVRVALAAGAIAVQAAFCWRAYPYPLAAYNPLLGGASQAQRVMLIGWGEGLDQVAAFLNSRPDADTLVVTTLYHEALRPHVLGRTIRIGEAVPLDYFVVYVNMAQRQLVPNSVRRLIEQNPPVFTARVGGQPYAWVYRVPPGVRVPALERPAEGAADDTAPRPGRP